MSLTIKKKLILGFCFLILLSVVGGLLNSSSLKSIKGKAQVTKNESAPLALDAAEMKLCVIQVQQWLTDISATRGLEGFDDGYAEAENYANRFHELLNKFRKVYSQKNNRSVIAKLNEMESSFKEYYNMGKKMADTYIKYGPAEGNKMMEQFDPFAAKMADNIESFVKEEMGKLFSSMDNIVDNSNSGINLAIFILIASIIAGIALSLSLSRSIGTGIDNVVTAIISAENNNDLTETIEVTSQDELGDLAGGFNSFIAKMHKIIQDISLKASQVASSSAEISATSEETSACSKEQATQCEAVSATTEEMTATTTEMAQNAHHVSNLAKETNESAERGKKIMTDAIEGINQIAKWVSQSGETMVQLGKSSEKIGEVISVIDDIADQTNLLALNAAIEAARAGEQGRGFAVVADEVRKLAERTQHATKEIGETIESIQHETDQAVTAMESGTREVKKGVDLAHEAEGALGDITGKIKQAHNEMDQLASAIEQQSAASSETATNVGHISNAAKEFSTSAQESAKASEDLGRLAEEMSEMVRQFKV